MARLAQAGSPASSPEGKATGSQSAGRRVNAHRSASRSRSLERRPRLTRSGSFIAGIIVLASLSARQELIVTRKRTSMLK
jgi:hypothetical protein